MITNDLDSLLAQNKLTITPAFNQGFIRDGSQWFIGHETHQGDLVFRLAFFGDFARHLSLTWQGHAGDLSPEQKQAFDKFTKDSAKENQKERLRFWEETKVHVQKEWDGFSTVGESPYLTKKKLSGLYGCRLDAHARGARTLVPARDSDGTLWGYQTIFSEKLDIGDKVFRSGARKESCFHHLGTLQDGPAIYLCEGIATAISVYEALKKESPVVSCFDAGNLVHVARALRSKYKTSPFVFCADHDQFPAKDGKIYHTGRVKAEQAARVVKNARVVLPEFKNLDTRPTDFDDLRLLEGLDTVREQIVDSEKAKGDLSGPPTRDETKPSPGLGESRLINYLIARYKDAGGPTLIRQGKDFFHYTGTHWTHLDPLMAADSFKKELDHLAHGKLKFKDIASAYNRWFLHVPQVPHGVNLFAPNPFAQNFANGTVHLLPRSDGTFEIVMRAHRREDYLIHCHEFDYKEEAPLNAEFESALDRIWEGDPDIEKKKQAYFEVLGACLIPAFRKLVLFVGKPKSGKSTLVLFASNMVHADYRCSVDPTQFYGFNLESMTGKLLNYDTDINLTQTISDSILKKVEDKLPMRIRRKGLADIYAPIPGMHLFAANRMPVSAEGGSAYDRRMLVFKCDKFQPATEAYIQDFAQHVWREGCQGIVRRAIEGMKRLAGNGGHFTIPESSREEIETWQKDQGDLVQDFFRDLDEGGLSNVNNKVFRVKGARILRQHLWEIFKAWVLDSSPRQVHLGKIKFFGRCAALGHPQKVIRGAWYFEDLSVEPGEESEV